jgi:hypothetical protein
MSEVIPYKNIQLSEKLEFLLVVGKLEATINGKNEPVYFYESDNLDMMLVVKVGGRLIDFVNELIEYKGIYPKLQNYLISDNKKQFTV